MNIKKSYTIVRTLTDYNNMVDHINNHDYFAFDTETTGLNTRTDKIVGLSISGKKGVAFYLPIGEWSVYKKEFIYVDWQSIKIKEVLQMLTKKELLMWNGSFDIRMVKSNYGIDLTPCFLADVQLMKHTINEEGKFGLKTVAVEYQRQLGLDMEKAANEEQIELKENVKKNGGSTTKKCYEMYKADLDILGKYACADADLTLRLAELFGDKLVEEGLEQFFYEEEVMPLYKHVTIPMEEKGVKIDKDLIIETKREIEVDMDRLEQEIINEIAHDPSAQKWWSDMTEKEYPVSKAGLFGQAVALHYKLDLPITASGKFSLSAANIKKHCRPCKASGFLLGNSDLDEEDIADIRDIVHFNYKNKKFINIQSKPQMGDFVFNYLGIKPLSKTPGGKGQFDDTMIQYLVDNYGFKWATLLGDYNKLSKIRSTYIDRFLDNEENGRYYFSYKQWGTISGRYGSDAQQLPRPKEDGELSPLVLRYNNLIRSFMIAEDERVFIDCDYESLEPHCFAHVSNDDGIRDIFRKDHDFYSTIAIKTEKLEGVSADKKATNYLKKVDPVKRQSAKPYSLGIPYGMKSYALSKTLDVEEEVAEKLIDGYLSAFPDLHKWMLRSEKMAKEKGYVRTETGRIRHLPRVKELYKQHKDKLLDFKYRNKLIKLYTQKMERDEAKKLVKNMYLDYKNGLNNAKNFQVQGLAASVVNRSAIAVNLEFKKLGIDGLVIAQIHDQLIFNVSKKDSKRGLKVVQDLMESTVKLSLSLKAPPELSSNWKEGH